MVQPLELDPAVPDARPTSQPRRSTRRQPRPNRRRPEPRRCWRRSRRSDDATSSRGGRASKTESLTLDIAPNDPVLAFLAGCHRARSTCHAAAGLASGHDMRESGVELVVPLVASGEMVGLLALGQRLVGARLLPRRPAPARHAGPLRGPGPAARPDGAPAAGRGASAGAHRARAASRPADPAAVPAQSLPNLAGWDLSAFYLPARTVGGDFYDVMELPDGRIMVVTGDVTDKGVPAALVMASTHALLREAGPRLISPAAVLGRVNELLCSDIPAHMFVTCLVLVFDLETGEVVFANAGHNLPFVRGAEGAASCAPPECRWA